MSKIKVTQRRSVAGQPEKVRAVVRGLGLKGIGKSKLHKDNNCIRGMVNRVSHLVEYELID